ncbi:hypothetical protein C8F04DRAFT_1195848 [Mycena alexandri]|uniref:Uncharacterized protein n=1 Tax=Mycena alexandri TaxID=1745969 RepID=A0AAD6S4K0_9AGAR|nr:hypothetical protein C8F04DRAFT_1195848 [Mycena alexandri]
MSESKSRQWAGHRPRQQFFLDYERHNNECLPDGSFLVLLPKDETIKAFHNRLEIGSRVYRILEDLLAEKEVLAKAVASFNTVRRKGKADIHILELPEDDCLED